ncbi:hypothetical protein BCV70DRAFT_198103 [Testicularia cyperi]|uniref:Uncharacterized protein n=1 Tax=Testicularia cyperi TaxID=1882483 RepID=A0A317XVC5_9BASI|nr:hypothetical protein BCV70DRAFT_198103 [Testicularia cyperi]
MPASGGPSLRCATACHAGSSIAIARLQSLPSLSTALDLSLILAQLHLVLIDQPSVTPSAQEKTLLYSPIPLLAALGPPSHLQLHLQRLFAW